MRLLILALLASPCFGAYVYSKKISVGGSVVTSGPHADYRMLISDTDSSLATFANGGKVQHASGYDIAYFTNPDCSTGQIAYKRISWNAVTGAVVHKVYVNNINNGTEIYRCYGDASITTDQQNSAGVYVSSVGGAWGLDDNAANTTVADGTGNAATGTSAANTSTKTVTGKIASGLTFNGSSDVVTVANNSTLNASTGLTIHGWVKRNNTGVFSRILFKETTAGDHFVYGLQFNSSDLLSGALSTGAPTSYFCSGTTAVTSTSAWQHVAMTYNATGSVMKIFLNGVEEVSGTPGVTGCGSGVLYSGNLTSSTGVLAMGRLRFSSTYYYGNLDEDDIEVENVVRAPGWIATEYANESSPGTFYTVGSENVLISNRARARIIVQ